MDSEWVRLLYSIVSVGIALLVLWSGNFPRESRYKQIFYPLTALAFTIIGSLLYYKFFHPFVKLVKLLMDRGISWTGISGQLPPDHYPTLYFALFIMLFFALVKQAVGVLFRISRFLQQRKEKKQKKGPGVRRVVRDKPSLAYYRVENTRSIVLQPEWEFIFIFIKYFCWIIGGVVFLTLIIYAFDLHVAVGSFRLTVPGTLILALFVGLESMWYLGGPRSDLLDEFVDGNPVQAVQAGDYSRLWKEYQQRWPEKLLYAGKIPAVSHPRTNKENLLSQLDTGGEFNQELVSGISNLIDAGYSLTARDCQIIKELYAGNDIIIAGSNRNHTAPLLFDVFQRAVRRDKNVLILLPYGNIEETTYTEAFQEWFGKWKQDFSDESGLAVPRFFTPNSHIEPGDKILIASPWDLMDENTTRNEWFSRLELVVFFDGATIFARGLTPSSVLLNIFRQGEHHVPGNARKKIQSIVVADYRKSLESSVRRNLDIGRGSELRVMKAESPNVSVLVWQLEGDPAFQDKVFDGYIERHLGAEVVLAVLPWRDRLSPIRLSGQEDVPWGEYIEELENFKTSLKKSVTSDDIYAVQALKQIRCAPISHLQEDTERMILLTRDNQNNLVTALQKGNVFANKEILAHVVSPPYLLRDYLVNNIDYFLKTSLYPLTGKLMVSKSSLAYNLLERMIHKGIEEGELLNELRRLEPGARNAGKSLRSLFIEVYNIDIVNINRLSVDTRYVFTGTRFEEKHIFRLSSSQTRNDFDTYWMDQVTITNQFGHEMGRVYRDHLFQDYLPGQIHAFSEKPYIVDGFDSGAGILRVSHTTPKNIIRYWNQNCIMLSRIDPPILDAYYQKLRQNGLLVERKLCEAQFEVLTEGYYFEDQKNLKFYSLGQKEINREYRLGRVLVLTFSQVDKKGGAGLGSPYLSSTLVVLLNEVFLTLFPDSYRYLLVCSDTAGAETSDLGRMLFNEFHDNTGRSGTGKKGSAKSGASINLYIFEDSHQDLGLLQSIFDEWEYVFRVIDDYVTWVLKGRTGKVSANENRSADNEDNNKGEDGNTEKPVQPEIDRLRYLKFQQDKVPSFIDLEGVSGFLRSIVGENPTTRARDEFYASVEEEIDIEPVKGEHQCDFCARPLSPGQLEILDDGRERCPRCSENAIDRLRDSEKRDLMGVLAEAREYFQKDLGIHLPEYINVEFTTAAEIAARFNVEFKPAAAYNPRTIGYAETIGDRHVIKIENGSPYHLTLATIVHELTHIWQNEHLDANRMGGGQKRLLLLEGHAVWASMNCLEIKNMALGFRKATAAREDEYGTGYRQMVQMLAESSRFKDPFAMLKEKFPLK